MKNTDEEKKTNSSVKGPDTDKDKENGHKKHSVSALQAAALGRSATAQVDRHSNSGLANTGTNISYEGATAPGAGGSAGTGYASGKEAADERLSSESDYDNARVEEPLKKDDKGTKKNK